MTDTPSTFKDVEDSIDALGNFALEEIKKLQRERDHAWNLGYTAGWKACSEYHEKSVEVIEKILAGR
jgi:hypothetical protein